MKTFSYKQKELARFMPKRDQSSNKGTYGRLLVIGGSVGMSGAPYFTAKSAYRMGCGIVGIFTPEENRIALQTLIPEAVLSVYDSENPDLSRLGAALGRADAVAIGMGLSMSETALEILKYTLKNVKCPLLLDADALNLISKDRGLWDALSVPAIITPHPLEMSRLSGENVEKITADIPAFAQSFANEYSTVTVLKDHNTAVAEPHAEIVYINQSGNSGMSTAGAGDVLDGIIGALLATGVEPYTAATLGVYIHGLAGDSAADMLSEYSVMASDIIDCIPDVLLGV